MKNGNGKNSDDFEKMKRGFDPKYSYLIADKKLDTKLQPDFIDLIKIFSQNGRNEPEYKIIKDKKRKREHLVIKLNHSDKKNAIKKVMSLSFPEELSIYFYESKSKKNESKR